MLAWMPHAFRGHAHPACAHVLGIRRLFVVRSIRTSQLHHYFFPDSFVGTAIGHWRCLPWGFAGQIRARPPLVSHLLRRTVPRAQELLFCGLPYCLTTGHLDCMVL